MFPPFSCYWVVLRQKLSSWCVCVTFEDTFTCPSCNCDSCHSSSTSTKHLHYHCICRLQDEGMWHNVNTALTYICWAGEQPVEISSINTQFSFCYPHPSTWWASFRYVYLFFFFIFNSGQSSNGILSLEFFSVSFRAVNDSCNWVAFLAGVFL